MHSARKPRGFSLIEILVVITVIIVISTLAVSLFRAAGKKGRDTRRKADLSSISQALEIYYQRNNHYPGSGTWYFSYNGNTNWIPELVPAGTPNLYFPSGEVPADPYTNTGDPTGGGAGYAYRVATGTEGTGCTRGDQYYLLVTKLESPSDPERLSQKPMTWCGEALDTMYNGQDYILTNP